MIEIKAGFLPLVDAALLIVCRELGFAKAHGIALTLFRETSWANVRDRLSVGQFDVAQMLAPLPIAQNLGLSPLRERLIVPFALGLGGNAITVSKALHIKLIENGLGPKSSAAEAGLALKAVIARRRSASADNLVFAVVHEFSSHAFELRYWLAACGIDPRTDVNFTIVPPGLMADALANNNIDGFCVGEPWNSVARANGIGRVVATKASIWRSSPEKVLATRESWAVQNVEALDQLIAALSESAIWASLPENHADLAQLLSHDEHVGVSQELIMQSLEGVVQPHQKQDDFILFSERAANFPWQSHALWFYAQMVRWDRATYSQAAAETAKFTYRPDIYRRALQHAGVALPGASSKVEGALASPAFMPAKNGRLSLGPDGFFDDVKFDPDKLEAYIRQSSSTVALHKN